MTARTITITDADARELEWLRGGVNGLIFSLRMLNLTLQGSALEKATGLTDLAPLLQLADAIDACEVIDRILEDTRGAR